jgi:hypothetical protein
MLTKARGLARKQTYQFGLVGAWGYPTRPFSAGILVISWIICPRDALSPSLVPSLEKNSTDFGARSSERVRPRVNHLLLR